MTRSAFPFWVCALIASALAACSGNSGLPSPSPGYAALPASGSSPIQHIVVVVQENRTFNDLFATFPGATGTTTGEEKIGCGKHGKDVQIPLSEVNLEATYDLNHLYESYLTAYDGGKMDGFNCIKNQDRKNEGKKPYQYVNPAQVTSYWTLASTYALANMMFATQGSGSFTAHQDLIRGGTELNAYESMIDDPDSARAWGCDSPAGTVTSLITTSLKYEPNAGPLPCTKDFPSSGSTYETLRDLLDGQSIAWKYYVPKFKDYTPGALWNAFDVIAPVRYGSEWGTNVSWPEKNIFKDITNGTLPAVSWVIPDGANSDHPGYGKDTGPSWVTSVVNAVGNSSYWNSSVVIVVWDDWGGFYDPVAPQNLDDQGGPGFRVGMIAVSPYAIPGDISQTVYGFGSIVRFIEDTFNLGRLGTTDETSTSIADMFNFNQAPRAFKTVRAKYSRAFFLRQAPSNLPVDTQ